MSVQSLTFLLFLTATTLLCLLVGRSSRAAGILALTGCSVLFCLLGQRGIESFCVLLAGCGVTAWAVRRNSRAGIRLACIYHIAVLAMFKYGGFFVDGLDWMPIGLSFFTFQQLWYLREVYTSDYVPQRGDSLLLYSFFFPTLTSGPILRPSALFPQMCNGHFLRPDWADISEGLRDICLGMGKKVLLADPLGVLVGNGWDMRVNLSAPGAWLVMLAYTLQLYLDFSGYSDIACGCGRLLGLRLPINFDMPYRALSVGEFWKRWHITLTTFLRECLYFPLGGSRKGRWRTCVNILVVYLVSGLWHGAGWTFVIWGLLHGLAQVLERLLGRQLKRLPKTLRWAGTFLFVNLAWVFFRAPSLTAAGELLRAAVCGGWSLPLEALTVGMLDSETAALMVLLPKLSSYLPEIVSMALLGAGLWVSLRPWRVSERQGRLSTGTIGAIACGVVLVWAVLSFSSVASFIYSNF